MVAGARRKVKVKLLLVCVLGIAIFGAGLASYFLYWHLQGQALVVHAKNHQLQVRLYGKNEPNKPKPAVLFFIGWSPGGAPWTPSQYLASRLAKDKDMLCMVVALRGMGSPGDIGSLTRKDFLDDTMEAYDYFAAMKSVDKQQIYVVGESFGAYMACVLSSKRPVKAISLRVPTDFPAAGFAETPQIQFAGNLTRDWKSMIHQPNDSPTLLATHNFHGRIQLVASENDEIVPWQTIQNYRSAMQDNPKFDLVVMKNLGHSLMNPVRILEYYQILRDGIFNTPQIRPN